MKAKGSKGMEEYSKDTANPNDADKMEEVGEAPEASVHDEHETKSHLNTLMEAHGILGDENKMSKVHALAGRHKKAIEHMTKIKPIKAEKPIRSIEDMKARAQKKFGTPSGS